MGIGSLKGYSLFRARYNFKIFKDSTFKQIILLKKSFSTSIGYFAEGMLARGSKPLKDKGYLPTSWVTHKKLALRHFCGRPGVRLQRA